MAAVVVGVPFHSMAEVTSVVVEAESGALGSDFFIGNSGTVIYISNGNNNVGLGSTSPRVPGRVASYNVTFPSAGTYELYARLRIGPGGPDDDSFFYGNGFGSKQVDAAGDWITVSGVDVRGFTNPTDVVTVGGSAGSSVWKWVNLSQDTGASGEPPIAFTVGGGDLNQTFQIGGREDGLDLDRFVFGMAGSPFAVADLDALMGPEPPIFGQISVPQFLTTGDLSMSAYGTAGHHYAQEWSDRLTPPVTWMALLTNTADSNGLVSFTNTPAESQAFYRLLDVTPIDTNVPPLVYSVENTGANYPLPPLPPFVDLPIIQPLTDPFMWSATDPFNWTYPSGRSTNFVDWSHRRAEIKAEIENYEIGVKPAVDLANVFASFSGSTLTVRVTNTVNGRTLTLTSSVSIPAGSGPHPVIIGMNSPNGSIGLGGRPIATITFSHNQVTTYLSPSLSDPYYQLYQNLGLDLDNTGQYGAWAWGVSRLIDGLFKLNGNLGGAQINLERIGVTGCSYAGKMALFAGALDERIALTIPQESGGGGAPNWRYSATEPVGTVEGLAQTDHNWFREDMFQFGGANTAKLPHDHHELMAMVAPRALFATGNPDGATWLSNPSCYVSCKAVERVYDTWGIGDRFGYNINGGKSHCVFSGDVVTDVYAFLDKFLLGMTNLNTITNRHVPASYSTIDYARWTEWWGTTDPTFAGGVGATYTNTYEPECATVGSNWLIVSDAAASNGKYVTLNPSVPQGDLNTPPASAAAHIVIPVSVPTNGVAAIFARVNCPTADDDSFWVQVDGGSFTMINNISNGGNWTWALFANPNLTAGAHTLTIAHRENGALLDKILISDYQFSPSGMGPDAAILCP